MNVGVVGLGNVGSALGAGLALLKSDYNVLGCDKNLEKRETFHRDTGFEAEESSDRLLSECNLVILCVRTSQVRHWLVAHAKQIGSTHTIVCLSAGVTIAQISEPLVVTAPGVRRAITNINVAIRSGVTVLLDPPPDASDRSRADVDRIFGELGAVVRVQSEADLDALSVLPGCAPAAIAIFVQGLRTFGVRAGFDPGTATTIAVQCLGATARLFQQTGMAPENLKRKVAAPGGAVEHLLSAPESDRIEKAASDWMEVVLRHLARPR